MLERFHWHVLVGILQRRLGSAVIACVAGFWVCFGFLGALIVASVLRRSNSPVAHAFLGVAIGGLGYVAFQHFQDPPLRSVTLTTPSSHDELSVMTFNLRYGTAADGPNCWEHRRVLVVRTILESGATIVGCQEGLRFQLDFLASELGWRWVAVVDTEHDSADSAILYDPQTVELEEHASFWLSTTPSQRSKIPGSDQFRTTTWGRFRMLKGAGATVMVVNTHLDHVRESARLTQALIMRQEMERVVATMPSTSVVVTGDFNSLRRGAIWHAFVSGGLYEDAWLVAESRPHTAFTTFHNFWGDRAESLFVRPPALLIVSLLSLFTTELPGAWPARDLHIDWILVRCDHDHDHRDRRGVGVVVKSVQVVPALPGPPASDHHPVMAVVAVPVQ